MMTREEVAEIMTYCQEHTVSHKDRLAELGIAPWRFYDAKSRYAKQQAQAESCGGEFLQLVPGGTFVPVPAFASTTGRRPKSKKLDARAQMMTIELRTPSGTLMRIQGELDASFLSSIIQGA